MADFVLRAPPRLRFGAAVSLAGQIGTGGPIDLAAAATARAVGAGTLLRGVNLAGSGVASAPAVAALLKGIRLAAAATAGASTAAALDPQPPSFSFNPWRQIAVDQSKNPFLGPEAGAGGSKHVMWQWHPVKKRVYTWGGDYSTGMANFATGQNDGQINGGDSFSTNASPQTGPYSLSGSLQNDQYSIDPYDTATAQWRLEHQYLPRNNSGSMEARPARPDQGSLVWDPVRGKFWGIYTALRTEFFYPTGAGPYDAWANGSFNASPVEPSGTWSWTPSSIGPNGTWTLESTARTVVRSGSPTEYQSGGVLVTSSASERIAYWERDPTTDRIFGVGTDKVFIFNPGTVSYEWRRLSTTGYSYFSMSSSMVAILGNYLYAYAYARASGTGTRYSYLVRINISAMLALANDGVITNFTLHLLPWSLSHKHMVNPIDGLTYDDTFGVWEGQNQGFENWTEKNGLYAIDEKIVCAGTYNGIYDDGEPGYPSGSVAATTRLHVFAPSNQTFYQCDTPSDTAICASSWVALPDSYEILMGLSSIGYSGSKLWAYRPTHIGPLRVGDSNGFSANEGNDPEPNMNGQVKWQSSFTLNDGGLIFWGTGGHGTGDNNSVRKYWPSTKSVTRLYENNFGTLDQQQYDNKVYWFVPAVNKLVIPDHGVFNVATGVWDIGTLPPASNNGYQVVGTGANDFMYPDASVASVSSFKGQYNPFSAWSVEHDCGLAFSGGQGGVEPQPIIYFIVKSTSLGNGRPNRYTVYQRALPTSAGGATLLKARARDGCCFLGDYVYWVGGGDFIGGPTGASTPTPHFFRMNIVPHLTSTGAAITIERLPDCPVSLEFGLLRADKYLNALLLVCDGGLFAYDATYGQWVNLTSQTAYPSSWTGAYGGYLPASCLGDFVDTHAGATYRRFYWRPGSNDSWNYDSTNWAKFFSLKLTRS